MRFFHFSKKVIIMLALAVVCLASAVMLSYSEIFCTITDFSEHIISKASSVNRDIKKEVELYLLFVLSAFVFFVLLVKKTKSVSNNNEKDLSIIFEKFGLVTNLAKNKMVALLLIMVLVCMAYFVLPLSILTFFVCFFVLWFFKQREDIALKILCRIYLAVYFSINISLWIEAFFLHTTYLKRVFPICVAAAVFTYIFMSLERRNNNIVTMIVSYIAVLEIIICIFMEIQNTLLSREIVVSKTVMILTFILFSLLSLCIIVKNKTNINDKMYILIVFAMAWISNIKAYVSDISIDIFESANHGNSICGLLFNGEIPIVDNFDAHMLSNSIPALIHYLVNDDYLKCLSSPYSYFYSIVLMIAIYCMAREFSSNFVACFFALLINYEIFYVNHDAVPNPCSFMSWSILVVFFLLWERKRDVKSSCVLWILAASSVFSQIDAGLAFGVPVILMPIYICASEKKIKELKRYIFTGLSVAVIIGIGIFGVISYRYNFSYWLKRFLGDVSSNQHWGYGEIPIKDLIGLYFILPIVLLTAIVIVKKLLGFTKRQQYIINILLGTFILNSPRIIVRHTSKESVIYVKSIPYLIFSLLVLLVVYKFYQNYKNKKKISNCLNPQFAIAVLFIAVILACCNVFGYSIEYNENTAAVVVSAYNTQNSKSYLKEGETKQCVEKMRSILPILLKENETFFDFSNSSALFNLMKLDNPIYENQSPALIVGDKGQLNTINELEKKKSQIPIVLIRNDYSCFGTKLDGINNSDRHYIIYEYLLDNYSFLYSDDAIELWCLPVKYEEYSLALRKNGFYSKDNTSTNIHYLGAIPYLWANEDSVDIREYKPISYDYNDSTIMCTDGYYIVLQIEADKKEYDQEIDLEFDNDAIEVYKFDIMPGNNFYKIRVSNSYNWKNARLVSITSSCFSNEKNSVFVTKEK